MHHDPWLDVPFGFNRPVHPLAYAGAASADRDGSPEFMSSPAFSIGASSSAAKEKGTGKSKEPSAAQLAEEIAEARQVLGDGSAPWIQQAVDREDETHVDCPPAPPVPKAPSPAPPTPLRPAAKSPPPAPPAPQSPKPLSTAASATPKKSPPTVPPALIVNAPPPPRDAKDLPPLLAAPEA